MDQSLLFNELMKRQMGQQQPATYAPTKLPPQQAAGMWSSTTPQPGGAQPQGGMPPQSAAGGAASPMGGPQSVAPGGGGPPGGLPGMGPPQAGGQTNTHSQDERAQNASVMTSAYQNGWSPNPMMARMMMGKR